MSKNASFVFFFLLAILVVLLPEFALASGLEDTVGSGLCRIVGALQGGVGRGIATLAIIFLGIGAFFGKVSWALATQTAVGITVIFGATAIVNTVSSTLASASGCS